jgi:hypothetical protein
MDLPAPATLTSHQPPALLVARLLEGNAESTAGRAALLNPHGLDLLQMLEGGAQSVAVIVGHARRAAGGSPASGLLVAATDVVLKRPAQPGEPVEVSIALIQTLGPLRRDRIIVTGTAGVVLLTAAVTTAATDAP